MKAGWEVKALGEVCEIYQPKTISAKEMTPDGEYVVYGANGPIGRYSEYNHAEPQLLVTCRGATCGAVNTSEPFSWITGNAMVIRPKSGDMLLKFVEYFFHGAVCLDGVITGAAQPQITRQSLAPVTIPLPPLDEQKRIVAVLDAAFEGLTRARAHTETNLQNARQLFSHTAGALLMDCASDAPMVPLELVTKLTRGHNPPKSDFIFEPKEGYVRFYQIRDRKTDDYAVYVPETRKLHRVKPDEILMTAYRHIGEVFRNADGAFNVALCKISNRDKSKLLDDYLFSIIPTDFVKGELLKYSERSLIPSMSVEHLKEIHIPLPTIAQQEVFVARLSEAQANAAQLQSHYRAKLADLDDLRQSLLQKAFAGELT